MKSVAAISLEICIWNWKEKDRASKVRHHRITLCSIINAMPLRQVLVTVIPIKINPMVNEQEASESESESELALALALAQAAAADVTNIAIKAQT